MVEKHDNQVKAGKWLKENTPPTSRIGLITNVETVSFYAQRYAIDIERIIVPDSWQWPCIQEGYTSPGLTYRCLESLEVDYIVDYAYNPSISSVATEYPLKFDLVKAIGTDQHSVSIYRCNFYPASANAEMEEI